MKTNLFFRTTVVAALASAFGSVAFAQDYTFTDLGAGAAYGINDSGLITGHNGTAQMATWDNGTETSLTRLGFYDNGFAVNNAGQVVGYYDATSTSNAMPIMRGEEWNAGAGSALQTPDIRNSIGYAINDNGVSVGFSYSGKNDQRQYATVWSNGNATLLATTAGDTYSAARGINDAGQIVGDEFKTAGMTQAVLWTNAGPTVLGAVSGETSSEAKAINGSGQIAGYITTSNVLHEAVIWNGLKPTVLGSLGGTNSAAFALNNAGEAVGFSTTAGNTLQQATLWENGKVIDLNSYLTATEIKQGWVLEEATGINDSGTIVGFAENTFTGATDAFEMAIPVPEPKTPLMFLAGLAVVLLTLGQRKGSAKRAI